MSLDDIGQKLKTAREGQGLSHAQIYERTKIPINHLVALDNGSSEDLPEPIYVSGFIKRYGDCVGLDGQALAEEFRKAFDKKSGNGDSPWGKPVPVAPVIVNAPYNAGRVKVEESPLTILKNIPFYALWVVFIVGLVTFLWQWSNNANTAQQDPYLLSVGQSPAGRYAAPPTNPAQQPTVAAQTNAAGQPGGDLNTSAPPQPPATNDSRISLSASRNVWVEVKAVSSGASLYAGYLESGDRRDFQDSQGLIVRAGNGGSLQVEHDGKTEAFGLSGKVTEKTFMARGAQGQTDTAEKTTADAQTLAQAQAKAQAAKKPTVKRSSSSSSSRASRARGLDEGGTRSIPGESVGGTRSIDVPYRYNDGRLDSE